MMSNLITPMDSAAKKVRKPYTITKSRENWTEEEHDKFLEALQLFDRDWKKIEDYVGSKSVIQIRSHAQKYFLKVQKNGTLAHVPPPRPKRKAAHPYPQKAPKNVSVPLQSPVAYPSATLSTGYITWDDTCATESHERNGLNCAMSSHGTFPSAPSSQEFTYPGNEVKPDFSEVYTFIGSIFDPDTKDHMPRLKEMNPINFETVLVLMRNLTTNLSSPDFEPIKTVLRSYDTGKRIVEIPFGEAIVAE